MIMQNLVHGVFNTTIDVLVAFKVRCAEKGIDFGKFSWVGSEQAPKFDPKDPETVVVLDATLDTLAETVDFAWEWTADMQKSARRTDNMMRLNHNKLRLRSDERYADAQGDGSEFVPYILKWVRIKLDTNVGEVLYRALDEKESPGCALLFMAAQHPERIRAIDHKNRFAFWLPGLKRRAPGEFQVWSYIPIVSYDQIDGTVHLTCCVGYMQLFDVAVPSFRV